VPARRVADRRRPLVLGERVGLADVVGAPGRPFVGRGEGDGGGDVLDIGPRRAQSRPAGFEQDRRAAVEHAPHEREEAVLPIAGPVDHRQA